MTALPPSSKPLSRIAALSAPLILFFLIQNVAGLGVLAIVGRLGAADVGALGLAGAVNGLLVALLYGFDTAVQALVARATGAGRRDEGLATLRATLALSAPAGFLLAAFTAIAGPAIAAALNPDPHSAALAAENLRAGALSIALMGLTIPVNGYWIATGAPRISLAVAAAIVPAQVIFTLILAPRFGLAGAGWAYSAACGVCLVIQGALVAKRIPELIRAGKLDGGPARILRVAWPVSLQQSLAHFALMTAYFIVAQRGVAETAVLSVIANIATLPIQVSTGLGVAAATLVGQTLGAGSVHGARWWGWRVAGVTSLVLAPVSLALVIAPEAVLALFLRDHAVLAMAVPPARILGAGVCLDVFGRVLSFALRGASATKLAAGVPFALHWVIQLPLMAFVALELHRGVTGMVTVEVGLSILEAVILGLVWSTGLWTGEPRPPAATALNGDERRIVIMGGAGAGKSTLGRTLGARLALPVTHMDRLVFGPGWTRRPDDAVLANLAVRLETDRWVVEGTYPWSWPLTLPRADLVIWIEQPPLTRLWRAWRKTRLHQGRERADRPEGCEEGFGFAYARDILSFGDYTPRVAAALTAAAPQARIVVLRGDGDMRRAVSRPGARWVLSESTKR